MVDKVDSKEYKDEYQSSTELPELPPDVHVRCAIDRARRIKFLEQDST